MTYIYIYMRDCEVMKIHKYQFFDVQAPGFWRRPAGKKLRPT